MFDTVTRRKLLQGSLVVAAGALAGGMAGRTRIVTAAEAAAQDSKPPTPAGLRRSHLGLCTYLVGAKMDLPTLIDVCEKSGMEGVELRTEHAHKVEPSLDAAGRAKVKEVFSKTKVRLYSLGSICEFHSTKPDDVKKQIETAKSFVQLASDLGAWGVKVRPNGLAKDVPEEQTLKQIGESIADVAEFGKSKNVVVVMEMHGSGTAEPPRCAKIMEFCKHPNAGLCWNSNGNDVKSGSVKESFELCKAWIRHAHVKDVDKGYPFEEFFKLLKGIDFTGYAMLECSAKGDPVEFLKACRARWEKMAG